MTRPLYMNSTDYLMSVFDHHLRSMGCAGNLSHLILGVPSAPDRADLQTRLLQASATFPMLSARQKRGRLSLLPYWQLPAQVDRRTPSVRSLCAGPESGMSMEQARIEVFNSALETGKGELVRFTLIEGSDGAEVVMTWAHALMDAHGAEAFLACIGDGLAILPAGMDIGKTHTRRPFEGQGLWKEMKQAWRALRRLDRIGTPPPLSIYTARSARAKPRQIAKVLSFTHEETALIRKESSRLCGFLGETTYCLASSLMALDRLCLACGIPVESFVVNLPSDARNKGSTAPVFSNFASFFIHCLRKSQVADLGSAIRAIQLQARESIGMSHGAEFDSFGTMVRRIPPRSYWDRMKISLNNEIGSLFFANTGNAPHALEQFLGQEVTYLHHATSVTGPPGLGLFFYSFKSKLCCTIALIDGLLTEQELSAFAEDLRKRLLDPASCTGGGA
jgi:hypothetical protein